MTGSRSDRQPSATRSAGLRPAALSTEADGRPHICILTSAHPVDDVRVNSKIAASFLAGGYRVSWVGPGMHAFCGSTLDPRISYHLTAPIASRYDRLVSAGRVASKAREVTDVDWYYTADPDGAEIALKLAGRSAARVLFDIHEVYHGALLDRWVFGRRVRPVRDYVRRRIIRSCGRCDLVMAVSDSVLGHYAAGSAGSVVVRNCAPLWFAGAGSEAVGGAGSVCPGGVLRVMHGRAVANNGTGVVLRALAGLAAGERVEVVMFPWSRGGGELLAGFGAEVGRLGVAGRLVLRESVAHSGMPAVLRSCAVGMIAYGRGLGVDSLPNRLFEYLAAGLAVLVPVYSGEIRRIVEGERIGLLVDFEDPAEVAGALRWFAGHPAETRAMGERARAAFLSRHNWEVQFDALLEAMAKAQVNR